MAIRNYANGLTNQGSSGYWINIPNGDTLAAADPNPIQVVFWRRAFPQPFNALGVVSDRPASGQMWPRGRE